MLHEHNSVVNFNGICLTRPSILNSLSSNIASVASLFLAAALVLAAGCAALESRPDAEVVKERAQARWDALVSGDVAKAYGYLSPASRSTMTLRQYEGGITKGFWKQAKVESVECSSGTLCEVHASIEYVYQGRMTKTPLKEAWLKEGATWWYVQK